MMKVLASWLYDYLDAPADFATPEEIADALTHAGLTVDAIRWIDLPVDGVITARVVRTEEHPQAARVQRVYVDTGDGIERHVWCGAFNLTAGDVVPLATPGTTLADGRTIGRRSILGIESDGMLCSARELGLGDDHSGILVLPASSDLGVGYGAALGLQPDVIFDLDLTRNRPDAWGYIGVAREVAASFDIGLNMPHAAVAPGEPRPVPVDIVAGDRCGRFTATLLSGIVVGDSPQWIRHRLEAVGMRSINNVVDVSNYVMLECNQPNHAYDAQTLGGGGFVVRRARPAETMVTLDGERRELDADDLLICDAEDAPIGIAGVMGGLESEITDQTTTVALEMAWFEPLGVMRTAGRLGLRTDASARNERGIDPYGIDRAIDRFVDLLSLTCPDLVRHGGASDSRAGVLPPPERRTAVRVERANRVLGTTLEATTIARLLEPIGLHTEIVDPSLLDVHLPSWRPDCAVEIDVIEEIARRHGYDRIGRIVPTSTVHGRLSTVQRRRRQLRDILIGLCISEAMPNPFLAPDSAARAGLDGAAVRITNPLVAEESVLRTSLRPGLLAAIAYNRSHRRTSIRLFEIGRVYPPSTAELPDEHEVLTVVLSASQAPEAVTVWREIAAAMGVGARLDQSAVPPGLHPTRSATLLAGRHAIGAIGEIAPDVLVAHGIDERVAIVELDLRFVLDLVPSPARYREVSREPSSDLDLAFVLDDAIPADRLEKALRQAGGPLVVELSLFDVYRDSSLGTDRRSLAYRMRLQAADRTLTDADIAEVRHRCAEAGAKIGATLRDGGAADRG